LRVQHEARKKQLQQGKNAPNNNQLKYCTNSHWYTHT
jgi:hypothetical protein